MFTRVLTVALMVSFAAAGQTFTEKISRELVFEKVSADNAVMISNIFGNVTVQSHGGPGIVVEVTKSVTAKTETRLETGKTEVQLGIIDRADTIILYVKDGCHQFTFKRSRDNNRGWGQGGWSYQSEGRNDCHLTYDYKMDFIVKVPASTNVIVNTINDGEVVVENVGGVVRAGNINGGIRLTNLQSQAEANTINGDVDIEYAKNPAKECRFYSLNGDINAIFQPGLSADLSFESFNGDIYTNIKKIQNLPAQIKKSDRGDGLTYKINGNQFKIGDGGALLDFETFNGNVYLKEKN
jgi:hypothetical protein